MKIGIISDTHDHHENVLKAIDFFNDRKVEYVLHAGDMVSPFTATAFSQLKAAKFIAVFGNCDGEKIMLKNNIEDFGGELHENGYKGQVDGRQVFMTHILGAIEAIAESGKYDLVIYGHTHHKDIRTVGDTLIINPGETTDWITGNSSIAVLDTSDMTVEEIPLNS